MAGRSSPVHATQAQTNELMKQKENICLVACKCGRVEMPWPCHASHTGFACARAATALSGAPCKLNGRLSSVVVEVEVEGSMMSLELGAPIRQSKFHHWSPPPPLEAWTVRACRLHEIDANHPSSTSCALLARTEHATLVMIGVHLSPLSVTKLVRCGIGFFLLFLFSIKSILWLFAW
jgi:hypothetical protein